MLFPSNADELISVEKKGAVITITNQIDLSGQIVRFDADCILLFVGGQIINGYIYFDNTAILTTGRLFNDCIKCVVNGKYSFQNISGKGLFRGETSGNYDNGIVLSAIANSIYTTPESAICGFVDGHTTSKYPGRDAVTLYVENNNPVPIIVTHARFDNDVVYLPSSFDIYQLKEGDYIDAFNDGYTLECSGGKQRWSSIIDSIDYGTHSVRVKYGGFYRVQEGGSKIAEVPPPGCVIYFKLTTKIWSLNTQVISRALDNNAVKTICGYELDVNNNIDDCYAEGMAVVSLGQVKGDLAFSTEGKWDVGYLARNPSISFYSRDAGDNTNKYVLRQDILSNGKYLPVGYIDNDFTYHQGKGYFSLAGETPCFSTTNGSIRFSKDEGILFTTSANNYGFSDGSFVIKRHSWDEGRMEFGDYSLWINKGKLYIKKGKPNSATDGKPFQENLSGTYRQRPMENVSVGEMYFCTDRMVPESDTNGIAIFYRGDGIWVDALGRIVR